jgi:hypothetical protein
LGETKEFNIHRFYLWVVYFFFIIMVFDMLHEVFMVFKYGLSHTTLFDKSFALFLTIISAFFAISFAKTRYCITNGTLIVKGFMKKDKILILNNVINIKIGEFFGPLSYVKIVFNNGDNLNAVSLR